MRRALGLALLLLVVTATPAFAHVTVHPSDVPAALFDVADGGHGEHVSTSSDGDDTGKDGTEPATFAALLVSGLAMMGAVAALVFARVREPA